MCIQCRTAAIWRQGIDPPTHELPVRWKAPDGGEPSEGRRWAAIEVHHTRALLFWSHGNAAKNGVNEIGPAECHDPGYARGGSPAHG